MPAAMDPQNYTPLWFLAVFGLVALVFPLVPLALAQLWFRFFAPPKPGASKNATYECGLVSTGDTWGSHKVHYYLYAIVFLIVDVETIFLLPFAVAFKGEEIGLGACLAMFVFVLLLAESLVWAWSRRFLEWK